MNLAVAILAALAVSASDRLSMADRLFNKGDYASARVEYAALKGEKSIAGDDLLYRLAECDRATEKREDALKEYGELLSRFPASKHAAKARLNRAMIMSEKDRASELKLLDTDSTDAKTRAAALYHLGQLGGDKDAYERSLKLDPKGKYATYAKCNLAALYAASASDEDIRRAVGLYLEVAFGEGTEFKEEALYLAAAASYRARKYGEADSLMRRYLRKYPEGRFADEAVSAAAWCGYMTGKYADAIAMCNAVSAKASKSVRDGTEHVKAISVYASGDRAAAKLLLKKYLDDFPEGRYRDSTELLVARIGFDEAAAAAEVAKAVECARRAAKYSKGASDRLRLGWALEKSGKGDEAAAEYVAVAKDFPGTDDAADAMYRKALVDLRAERWSAADLALKEALTGKLDASRKAEATYWRGVAGVRLGHETEGVAQLKAALASGRLTLDQDREARLMIADADFNSGKTDEAVAAYAKLVAEGAAERMSAAKTLTVGRLLKGDGAKLCAKVLVKANSAEWRQAGWALLGETEEKAGAFAAAIEAYRKSVAENCATETLPSTVRKLGALEAKSGDWEKAEPTLRKAIELNAGDIEARAESYLHLAEVARAKKDAKNARAYATVVMTLFEKTAYAKEAADLIKTLPEDEK